jgi:acid phosphatase (class A)
MEITNKAFIGRLVPRIVYSMVLICAGGFALNFSQTMASQPGKTPDPQRAVGYLHGAEPDFLLLLPPYPALDSNRDDIDVAAFRQMQVPDISTRWKLAEADDQMVYTRFSGALGVELDAAKLPVVIHLLNRMGRDALDTAFAAKNYFNRPRPYQRFAVAHVCGADAPPS